MLPSNVRSTEYMDSEPLDIAALQSRIRAGWRPQFVFFWSHTSPVAAIGNECLSQWYPAPFIIDGVSYRSAEQYMMAEKARLFGDREAVHRILETNDPHVAKEVGRQVSRFSERTWQERRFEIVVTGNEAKFSQNIALRQFLAGTGRCILAEASPTDEIWGIGLAADDLGATDPLAWRGHNLLGFALMHVRSRMRELKPLAKS